ncbi:MAG: hypothetical protein IK012_10060 [Fibrobacter sp.]|uniref:hypothetical protein n=1 Tax=Fibrobacter sp. TaxID=35828 RepID=UPI0025C34517|nr:hypothetical protein [Fibrobacter sp.]MBR4785575.1 hypothetical protein [Fibrobacter sp.]
MKRLTLLALCLSIVTAFAGSYDIEEFTASDAGTPDSYIKAEFGGQLKTAPADEVSSLQDGRLVVRQKFTDPFGEQPTAYQLFQGGKGDLSKLVPLKAEGVEYSKLVTTRLYARRGMPFEDDIEKVYFDGKAVYIPGFTTAVAFVDGEMVQLKADDASAEEASAEPSAAPEVASSEEEECDDYDPDCEDEDDDEDKVDVAGDIDESNAKADARDYAVSDASENATDRFGIADEVRFWSAIALSALAVTSAIIGVTQQMEGNKASDAYDDLDKLHSNIIDRIKTDCASDKEPAACEVALKQFASYPTSTPYSLADLERRMEVNKNTRDSYTLARNLWFGVTAVSLTAAIVLFVW